VWLDDRTYQDEWGVVRTMPPGAYYYDLIRAPLAEDASLSVIDRYHCQTLMTLAGTGGFGRRRASAPRDRLRGRGGPELFVLPALL